MSQSGKLMTSGDTAKSAAIICLRTVRRDIDAGSFLRDAIENETVRLTIGIARHEIGRIGKQYHEAPIGSTSTVDMAAFRGCSAASRKCDQPNQ